MNEQELRTLKCSICGQTQVITDNQLAIITTRNYLKTCDRCKKIAKKKGLPENFIMEDHSKKLEYIAKVRCV